VLLYHVNATLIARSANISDGTSTLVTLDAGLSVTLVKSGGSVTVNNIAVISADNMASNGVVHVIDAGVLVPTNFNLPGQNIPALVASDGLSSLDAALKATGLDTALSGTTSPFTVFAPIDAAFAKLPQNLYRGNDLNNVLLFHVFSGRRYYSEQVIAAAPVTITTLFVSPLGIPYNLTITNETTGVYVNGISKILTVNLDASNGVVHTVDTVISSQPLYDVALYSGLTTLLYFVDLAGLSGVLLDMKALNAYTVLAPSNDAFALLTENTLSWLNATRNKDTLTSVLTYHVAAPALWSRQITNGLSVNTVQGSPVVFNLLEGGVVSVNNAANVTLADANGYNGAAHVINRVLLPPGTSLPTQSILEVAAATSNVTSLVAALTSANLTSVFGLPNGPWTVFAPINSAFAALNSKAVDTSAKLVDVLTYHVIQGRYYSDDISHLSKLVTIEGKSISFDIYSGNTIQATSASGNVANVLVADIDCNNGVIHLVDTVLLPQGVTPDGAGSAFLSAAVTATAGIAVAAAAFRM
jgi:transforming growth factor-beta-induced protein